MFAVLKWALGKVMKILKNETYCKLMQILLALANMQISCQSLAVGHLPMWPQVPKKMNTDLSHICAVSGQYLKLDSMAYFQV